MTQRFDRIKWIAEAVRVGGVRHELRDPFRALAADGPCLKTALLPDRLAEQCRPPTSALSICSRSIRRSQYWRPRLFISSPPVFGAAQATLFYVVLAISLTLLRPKKAVTLDVVHVALINVLARLEVITENRSARSSHHP
jgi:hypothetical protein